MTLEVAFLILAEITAAKTCVSHAQVTTIAVAKELLGPSIACEVA
jgi:hypothetical protein